MGRGGFTYGNDSQFCAELTDIGGGLVNTTLLRGTGVATFTRATTATTIGPTGLVKAVATGVPRSCYDPFTGFYLGYWAEGARTNLCLQSEDLTTTWAGSDATISSNVIASPDGATTADRVIEGGGVGTEHYAFQNFVKAASALPYSWSIWLKAGTRTRCVLNFRGGTAADIADAVFNLTTGALVSTAIGGGFTSQSGSIQSFPNGWYRCTLMATTDAAASLSLRAKLDNGTTTSYNGDGVSFVHMWGSQLEQAAFPSSYIPTTTLAVTRNADTLSYVFAGNANAAVGTAYAELGLRGYSTGGTIQHALSFQNSGAAVMYLSSVASTQFKFSDGTNFPLRNGLSDMQNVVGKRAVSWGTGLLGTGDGLAPTVGAFDGDMGSTAIGIGSNTPTGSNWFGTIRNVKIWTTQLTDIVSLTQ